MCETMATSAGGPPALPISWNSRPPCVFAMKAAVPATSSVDVQESLRLIDLRLSEQRFRLALANGGITLFEQDQALRYVWVYPQHPDFPTDNIGKTDADLVPGPQGVALMDLKREVMQTGRPRRAEMRVTLPS